jgi:tRNA threonylcarbamoyladenosine biosynthesis protein TsaE
MKQVKRNIATPEAMEAFGTELATAIARLRLVTVRGPLGAGKTTLVRGLLHGLGHAGAVKSPTFTLVEPYELTGVTLHHFDLYRVRNPEELEFLGLRDYLREGSLCVVEWPERAGALLPEPDLEVIIDNPNGERRVLLTAHNPRGDAALDGLT